MKKHFFALTALLLAVCSLQAQVTFRPYVGINSSSLTKDLDSLAFNSGTGYQIGVDLQIGARFYVQPGVQVEYLKNELEPLGGDKTVLKRSRLRASALIGYSYGGVESTFSFRMFTGPNASINLSAKEDDVDIKDELKNLIFGWNVGVGADFSILFVDAGYQFGLSEIYDAVEAAPRNNLFYANAGLRVRF